MKITYEQLDRGILVTADDNGTLEHLAFEDANEAHAAVGQALGVGRAPETPRNAPRAPVAPSPESEYVADDAQERLPPQAANEERGRLAPATRRVGLMQPKKSAPPAGRGTGAR